MSSNTRKELFYYVTSGSNVMRDVHWCVTVDYQQIANDNIVNQIHGFTIDYSKFILITFSMIYIKEIWCPYCKLLSCLHALLCVRWGDKRNLMFMKSFFYDPRNLGQKELSRQKESFQVARLSVKDEDSQSMTMQHPWQTLLGLMGSMQSILGLTLKVIVLSCCRLQTMMLIVYRQVIMQPLGMEYHPPVEHQRTFLMTYNTKNLTWC